MPIRGIIRIMHNHPVLLEANKEYEVKSLITGPPSWYGGDGQTSVECRECRGVQFTFHYFGRNLKKVVSLTGKNIEILGVKGLISNRRMCCQHLVSFRTQKSQEVCTG